MALTADARWIPPAPVRAIGEALQGQQGYAAGSMLTSDDASAIQLAPGPAVDLLARWLDARFQLSPPSGTRRAASMRAAPTNAAGALRRRDPHEEGLAIDAMGRDVEKGTLMADLMVRFAGDLGVQYVLWRGTEWSSSPYGPAWEIYSGSNEHVDHVHIELSHAAARDTARMQENLRLLDAAFARFGSWRAVIETSGSLSALEGGGSPWVSIGKALALSVLLALLAYLVMSWWRERQLA